MNVWIDDLYVGCLNDKQKVLSAMETWQRENESRRLYLIDFEGCQYNYADYSQQILNLCSEDRKVVYLSATMEELQLQWVASVQEYIKMISQSLKKLSEMFYARPDGDAWRALVGLVDQLDLLQKAVQSPAVQSPAGQYWDNVGFANMLELLLRAMEIKDSVSVGDLLAYPLFDWLQELERKIAVCSA